VRKYKKGDFLSTKGEIGAKGEALSRGGTWQIGRRGLPRRNSDFFLEPSTSHSPKRKKRGDGGARTKTGMVMPVDVWDDWGISFSLSPLNDAGGERGEYCCVDTPRSGLKTSRRLRGRR